jgi:hypothetical protein
MCPVCLATAAVITAKATGSGGLTALVARVIRAIRKFHQTINEKEDRDVHEHD